MCDSCYIIMALIIIFTHLIVLYIYYKINQKRALHTHFYFEDVSSLKNMSNEELFDHLKVLESKKIISNIQVKKDCIRFEDRGLFYKRNFYFIPLKSGKLYYRGPVRIYLINKIKLKVVLNNIT